MPDPITPDCVYPTALYRRAQHVLVGLGGTAWWGDDYDVCMDASLQKTVEAKAVVRSYMGRG